MRKFTPIWAGMLLAMSGTQLQAMTLAEAIQNTLTTHPELRADINSRLTADEQAKLARGGYLPTIDIVAGVGRENIDSPTTRQLRGQSDDLNYRSAEVRLRQMLFDGFNTPNEIGRTDAVVNARAYQVLGTAESLALRTVEVYLDVLKRREMVDLARDNLQAHMRINDQINLRRQRGVGSTADVDQSEARLALAQNNLYTEEVNLADAEANFLSAVGRLPDQLQMPSIRAQMPASFQEAQQVVLDNNPFLKSAQSDVHAAEKQYEIAKSPFYPRFDVELAAAANENISGSEGHYDSWRAGVVMNYNLFNGMRDQARLRASAHQVNQAMDIRNNALRQLNENLRLSWNAMESARLQTPKAQEYAEYTTRVRSAYQQQFGLNQRSLLDLLDSENELFTANRRLIETRYNEEYSMYRVAATMGELLRKQNVVAPIQGAALAEVKSEAQLPYIQ